MLKNCWLWFIWNQYPVAHDITGINILDNQHHTYYSYQNRNFSHHLSSLDMCVTVSKNIFLKLYTGVRNICFKCSTLLAIYWQIQGNCHYHTTVYTTCILSFKTPSLVLQEYPPIHLHLERQWPNQAIVKIWQMFKEKSAVHLYPVHGEKLPERH